MRKEIKILIIALLILRVIVWLTGCKDKEIHEVKIVPNVVRVYDVESQDRSRMLKADYEKYLQKQADAANLVGDGQELADKHATGYREAEFLKHEYRMGIFTGIVEGASAPFRAGCISIKSQTGIEVEYVLMDSWESVQTELEKTKDDGVTKIVLFNNTYDESILNELRSGKYADMEAALEEAGLYDAGLYDQAVMSGGRVEGMQYAVPLLYNVSGMVRGEKYEGFFKDATTATREDYVSESLSYEEFINKLNQAMQNSDADSMDMPFLSAGFYENEVDLFLLASGMDWEGYKSQEELFKLMLDYRKIYQETQLDTQERGMSNQQLHMMYLKDNERLGYVDPCAPGTIDDLLLDLPDPSMEEEYAFVNITMAETYLTRSQYMVECSSAEDIAFHSILGTLNYSRTYTDGFYMNDNMLEMHEVGKMDYWPVGIAGDAEAYAAQLVSYAAVVEGGDETLAATVLKELLNYKTLGIYGLSPCIEVRDWQIEDWLSKKYYIGKVRSLKTAGSGEYTEGEEQAFWNNITGCEAGPLARAVASEQLQEQLKNVVTAEIPDREALTIWQDTLTEAVDSDLSAEAGFELLCERMDEWYGN